MMQVVSVTVIGALTLLAGHLLVSLVFWLVDRSHRSESPAEPEISPGGVLRGGIWIGVLERVAIYASLLAGWPEGVAITLAVKGLARYPELQAGTSSGAAERFIIGTFVSGLVAAAGAGLAHSAVL